MEMSTDIQTATNAFLQGNLQKADLLCRRVLQQEPTDLQAWLVLARISEHLGQSLHAQQYLAQARHLNPKLDVHAVTGPAKAEVSSAQPRYLLIKAWGFGFWSDVDHVYGSLLAAEITGRVPIVHWGSNSLFRDADTDNAFNSFFEPVSGVHWSDLQASGLNYFPTKWRADNLHVQDLNKWRGEGSRLTGMYMLNRHENVVVSDYHIKVNDLMPWIPHGHPFQQMNRSQIYRHLNEKYFRLKPHLAERVEHTWQTHMSHHHWLAVHVRGTDKVYEIGDLKQVNDSYAAQIDKILSINPQLHVFLMTDSQQVAEEFKVKFAGRLLTMDCQRGSGTTGVHLEGSPKTELGEQVIVDAYLASKCDYFLGNGGSNVSTAIRHLRHWSPGTYFLIGQDFLGSIDTSLHEW
jgi:protein O-GlcNAc transferase